jgi:hypothetical protein
MKFQAPKTKFQKNNPPAFEPNGIITDGQSFPAAI